jgi:hypothetical protein
LLLTTGQLAVDRGLALKAAVSGWHSSLDVTIGSRFTEKAEALAYSLCHSGLELTNKWTARVFLADGSVGAECSVK